MSSHLLLEGILDVKDPKGSADRKFWKAWRRVWISFSVIYPSGRREPYLLLSLSHSSSDTPEKEVKISRDGLRLFRCRSKSRPYRTWAMASGNKVILYFAAENEVQGQNWMQSVRNGLWPPCFSFQMLTDACRQEVSLIDDDNTFLSGLLGVYGRFVLTSEDTISLMHPHWGATLLEISLSNIKDVPFVREAEVSPAGVFSIVLKKDKGSKVKTLKFFSNAAKEVIEWVLSKVNAKGVKENKETSNNNILTLRKELRRMKTNKELIHEDKNATVLNSIPSVLNEETVPAENTATNINYDYENAQYLKFHLNTTNEHSGIYVNNTFNCSEYGKVKRKNMGDECEQILPQQSTENEYPTATQNKSSNLKSNEHTYANAVPMPTYSTDEESFKLSMNESNNMQNEYENLKLLNETEISYGMSSNASDSAIYSTVNKNKIENSTTSEKKPLTSQISTDETILATNTINKLDDNELSINSLKANFKNFEINSVFDANEISVPIPKDYGPTFHPNTELYSTVNKTKEKSTDEHLENLKLSIENSLNDYRSTKTDNTHLLPNLPSEFLDTSLNFTRPEDIVARGSSSSEEEIDISQLIAEESGGLNLGEYLYEDIIDRKGTLYEEIDQSDDEIQENLPPELPLRPKNLEIPNSLRLQKLSKSINQTLKVMENTESTKREFPKTKFIKKIKDTSRVMQISPSQENARESFVVDTKLPVSNTMLVIGLNSVNASRNISQ